MAGAARGGELELLRDLLTAAGSADTPRAMVRAIASPLASRMRLERLRLETPAGPAEWRAPSTSAGVSAVSPVPGLTIWTPAPLPHPFAEPAFRGALEQVVRAAVRHLTVVRRVADLSRRAHAENRALRAELGRMADPTRLVARSSAMRDVVTRMELVARHSTTVLLTGESGTGKEIAAREIHRRSPRSHRPFLQINCGAIPAGLVETELFGHERGAFTGADRRHAGVFERAHGGTLLLDEIGELPPEAQVKLLRLLQERQVTRVGGSESVQVDVRLIAATNRPLATLVREGRFREDLFYRLDVFSIVLPPLRQRRADLAALAADLVAELSARLGLPTPRISPALVRRLAAHDWPGNVRELANVLEAALILGGGHGLAPPDELGRARRESVAPTFAAAARRSIEDALHASRGTIYGAGGAAQRLGLKPATLQSKMKKLGIRRVDFT